LIDLRSASAEIIEKTLGFYYFLDPFTDSSENIFFVLSPSTHGVLVPNHIGVKARGEAAVPEWEVWYPGEIRLSEVEIAIRVTMSRPDPWEVNLNRDALAKLFPPEE
jgi:hypothetical protein